MWHLKFFGSVQAQSDGKTVEKFRTQKTIALIALLALKGAQSREHVATLLWPDAPPEAARNSLSAALSALRRELGTDVVSADRQSIAFVSGSVTSDVEAFDAALKGDDFAAAIGLYDGHLLPGLHDDPFPALGGEYQEKARGAFLARIQELENSGEVNLLRSVARRAISLFGDEERWFLALMRAHHLAGDFEAALRTYEALQRFARKTGDVVGESARALAKTIRRQKEQGCERPTVITAPPPTPISTGNFPPQWTRYFGREAERELLLHWLRGEEKLITLSGAGGSGKTRLAIETIKEVAADWPMAHFVHLASLSEPNLLYSAIRDSLGFAAAPDLPPLEQLERKLRGQKILLLLDNFEQLVDGGAANLQALRKRLPDATLLVTSRVVLNLPGEREFPVSPLPTPLQKTSLEAVRDCPSAAMFCDRSATQIDSQNAEAIGALCRRLDGIPLAIELAAARAKMLAPAQILERLEKHPDFLQSREFGVPPRHKTLRATIEWSVDLLPTEVREFFCRLCLFRGGFSIEAAEKVASPGVCAEWETIDLLEQLRAHSLLQIMETPAGPHFRLLEMLREWAAGQLSENDLECLKQRHFDFYLAQAEALRDFAVLMARQTEMEADIANSRAALSYAQTLPDTKPFCRLVSALCGFWELRSHFAEGCNWTRLALPLAENLSAQEKAQLLRGAGILFWYGGDLKQAKETLAISVDLYEQIDDEAGLAHALDMYGKAQMVRDECEDGRANGARATAIARKRQDIPRLASSLITQAWGYTNTKRPVESNLVLEETLAIAQSIGEPRLLAICHGSRALNFWGQGNDEATRAHCQSLLEAYKDDHGSYARGFAYGVVTLIGCGIDDWEMVRPILPAITKEHFAIGTRWEFINLFFTAGRFALRQQKYDLAGIFFAAAQDRCERNGYILVPCLADFALTPAEFNDLKNTPSGKAGWERGLHASDETIVSLVEQMCA